MALARGGEAVDSPIDWYDSLDEKTVQFWEEYDRVEPTGIADERHAYLCHLLDNILAALLNQHLTKENWSKRYKPRPPNEFMPAGSRPAKKEKKASLSQQLNEYASVISGHYNQPVQRGSNA